MNSFSEFMYLLLHSVGILSLERYDDASVCNDFVLESLRDTSESSLNLQKKFLGMMDQESN